MRETPPGGRPGQRDTLGESEGVAALFRSLLVAVVLVAPSAAGVDEPGRGYYHLLCLAVAYAVVTIWLVWRRIRWPLRRLLTLVIDIVLLTVLIHHSGGVKGGLFGLYYPIVVIGAMWFSLPGAIGAGALATACYVVGMTWLVAPDQMFYQLRFQVMPQVLLLFLTAVLCAWLAEAWHAERRLAEMTQQKIDQFQRDIDMAQELQTMILPPTLPSAPGLDVGVRARQAALVVGGDYYDAVKLDDGAFGLCIADVSGKSVPGQLRLPLVKYGFRVCATLFRDPVEVITRLNALLYGELPPEMFVSMVYLLVAPGQDTIRLAGKHCNPLHWVAATGQVHEVPLRGVALGADPDVQYHAVDLEFAPDDYLVLYTDGAIEAKDRRGEQLEVSGLIRMITDSTPESAQDLANWLFQAVEEQEVGAKHDDLTLVVLRRAPARPAGGQRLSR